jgi:hypothetical protein
VNRRTFVQNTALVAAGFSVWGRASAAAGSAPDVCGGAEVALVDRSLDGAARFAADARARGVQTFEFARDAADLWMREIEPRLRAGPVAIAGHTSAATAFCVELLARDYGARVVQRFEQGEAVVFVISQSPGRRAALAPEAVRAQWSHSHA